MLVVVAYGAGLATGLARFWVPAVCVGALAVAAASLVILSRSAAQAKDRPAGRADPSRAPRAQDDQRLAIVLALLVALGALCGAATRTAESGRCAARLAPGDVQLTVHLEERAGLDDGRVAARAPACGTGDVAVRWLRGRSAAAGTEARVRARWLPRDGAVPAAGTLVVLDAESLAVRPSLAERLRDATSRAARTLYGPRAPLIEALVTGRRGGLDPALTDAFAQSGLVHLLSISGFHVGVIVAWLVLLLRAAGVRQTPALLAASAAATLYVLWLGWPPPAARAAGLAWLLALGRLRQRNADPDALLAVTCLAVLLLDPWAVRDLGAWLSAASLWGATAFTRWSDRVVGRGWGWRMLAGSVGATLATAPITAAALGTVAPVGIVLNFVAIPLAAVAVPGVVASLLFAWWAPLAGALAAGAGAALALLEQLARLGARVPAGQVYVPASPGAAVPWLALLVAVCWVGSGRARLGRAARRAALVAAGASWLAAAGVARSRTAHDGATLALHLLDVGQGDAAAIRTPHGHWVLVDAGPRSDRDDAGRRVVAPFLLREGARGLDALVVSHAHADHVGGVAAVLDRLPAAAVLEPGEAVDDPVYAGALAAVAARGAEWHAVRDGAELAIDGVRFRVLHPDTAWAPWGLDLNEDSVVLLVEYGAFRGLFPGDAGLPAEARLAGRIGAVSLLKVGHHGSRGATGEAWLRELRPRAAVISSGRGNRYGHPSPDALARLGAAHAEVWRTDDLGSITVETDGHEMRVRGGRRAARYDLDRSPDEP